MKERMENEAMRLHGNIHSKKKKTRLISVN